MKKPIIYFEAKKGDMPQAIELITAIVERNFPSHEVKIYVDDK